MRFNKRIVQLSIVFALLILSSIFSNPASAAEMRNSAEAQQEEYAHYYDLDKITIGIIYDKHNKLTNGTADSLYQSLSLMTPDVKKLAVENLEQLKYALQYGELTIAIYVFDSNYNSLLISTRWGPKEYSWSDTMDIITSFNEMHHILATGNTKQAIKASHYALNVHGPGDEQVDAKHAFIFALWTLSDILEREYSTEAGSLAEDIKMASLQYFSQNFNDLIQRNLEPASPLGIEHPDTIKARKEKFFAEHPASLERKARDGYIIDPETNREIDPMTGELAPYVIDFIPEDSLTPSDFILSFLPEDSGLRGPLGGIVDKLLGFLLEQLGGLIGLSGETLEALANALFAIPDLVGAIQDPSSSKLKEFLDNLKPLIPLPADKMEYFDLIIDALFLLRGDAEDIQNFLTTAIELVVPDLGGSDDLVNILVTLLEIASPAVTDLAQGENFVDVILSVLNEKIVTDALTNLVNNVTSGATINSADTIGSETIVVDDAAETIELMVSSVSMIINLLTAQNFGPFILEYGPRMLDAIPGLSLSSTEKQLIMNATAMILVGAGIIDDLTIEEILGPLIKQFFGVNINTAKNAAKRILKAVSDFMDNPTDLAGLKNDVISALQDAGVSTSGFEDEVNAIEDLLSLIVAIKGKVTLNTATSMTSAIGNVLSAFGVGDSDAIDTVNQIINTLISIVSFIKNPPNLNEIVDDFISSFSSAGDVIEELITFILDLADGMLSTPLSADSGKLTSSMVGNSLASIELDTITTEWVSAASDMISLIFEIIGAANGNSVEGLLFTILQGGAYTLTQLTGIGVSYETLNGYFELAKSIFGTVVGWVEEPPSLSEVLAAVKAFLPSDFHDEADDIISFIIGIRDIFTSGFKAVFGKLTEWIAGLVTQLIEQLTGDFTSVLGDAEWPFLDIDIPISIGPFSLFDMNIQLGLKPGFAFNSELLGEMIFDLVFKGVSIFAAGSDFGDVLTTALKFVNIHPIFFAKLTLSDFGSGESSFISFLLETLGLQLSFSGSAWFEMSLFSVKNGVFSLDDFFKVIEWGFSFTLTISRTFTLLDFLTGGAGGSLNAIGKYIGLDAISITIGFTIGLEIVKRAATANRPESGSLTITLTIFFTVSLGIDILIAKLILTGTLEITLTLLQDLVEPTPMRVFISIVLIITVTIGFLFWDWDFEYRWSPGGFAPEDPYELTPSTQKKAEEEGALGIDQDNDGLSDKYEIETAGLNPMKADTDDDGLDDKFETQTLNTDPSKKDTDDDGLTDQTEFNLKTNPLAIDSDFDGLDDYEEVMVIGTDPLAFDTDEDGLDDYYEVNHAYNMTDITPSVSNIKIGGKYYDDHTDPLNPDTDFDGLVDGEEGERGIYYGPELYNESDHSGYIPDPPLFFNQGYTHPLDNDTDDDSYEQDWAGDITPRRRFLRDMTDLTEINGIEVIFIDPETGEPETPRIVRTNPTNPDSDGDTGVDEDGRENPPFGFFLNSDGYELALDPPTDPLDGDTDDDALIDGYEGILRPDANHTDANNPDTDGDGLGDLQEFLLRSNPRSVDTDGDGVTDGDEFFKYGTSPFLRDHDSDGLEDGEELFIYHSSPFLQDTDRDGLGDYEEVWIYFSDPADEDTDNDGLWDYDEIFIHYTDPFEVDTDGDGLFDGDEVMGLNYTVYVNGTAHNVTVYTDPTLWDTDGDSLLTLDQDGMISQSMSDGDEWKLKTRPDRMDTDEDGIQDGWELWLGKGKIPDFEPLKLDPLLNDTDGDTLRDGAEFVVANMSTLLYPYIGFYALTPYNTSAVNPDTDGDTVPDNIELDVGTLPNVNDTDNDTLGDNVELYVYNTSPFKVDTDGDGLNDTQELFGYEFPTNHSLYEANQTIITDPLESDSDGDLLPDGAEVYFYLKDPRDPDQNGNDILDGMEIDSDKDGLMDGEEFYVYFTAEAAEGGGPFQPDSDRDGLFDGQEVYETLSYPDDWDSDDDTYSDGLEWACGTDLLDNSTTLDDFEACFDELARLVILSPVHKKTYQTNAIPVIAYDPDDTVVSLKFRWKTKDAVNWSSYKMMQPDIPRGAGYWYMPGWSFNADNATVLVEFEAVRNDSSVFNREIEFKINYDPDLLELESPLDEQEYRFNEFQKPKLPITVNAGASYTMVWYRVYNDTTLITDNTTLSFEGGLQRYHEPEYLFPEVQGRNNYSVQIFAEDTSGVETSRTAFITVRTPTTQETVIKYGAPAGAVAGGAVIVNIAKRAGFKNPFKKGGN